MINFKHTQGHWINFNDMGVVASIYPLIPIFDIRRCSEISMEESHSNIQLASCAPDLLEALIRCVTDIEHGIYFDETLQQAKEAIKKATS